MDNHKKYCSIVWSLSKDKIFSSSLVVTHGMPGDIEPAIHSEWSLYWHSASEAPHFSGSTTLASECTVASSLSRQQQYQYQ